MITFVNIRAGIPLKKSRFMAKGFSGGNIGKPAWASAFVLLVGCSSAVTVVSEFPTPLVEPLPVRVGLIFGDELHDFIHVEALPQRSTWTIDLGDANIAMLQPLLNSMFLETRILDRDALTSGQDGFLDGILEPELERFEFDVPVGQRDEFVEVWMQYKLTLYDRNGEMVIEWPVTGYGKHELDGKEEDAVLAAAVVAMREVGATISTKFMEQPDVSYWLEERLDARE
jgi:hypothetical protein